MANKDYSKMSTKAKPEKVKDTETKPLAETKKEDKPKTEKPAKPAKGVVVDCERLNVRKEASLDSEVLTVLFAGDEVSVLNLKSENGFYKIKAGSVVGYSIVERIGLKK